MKKPPKKINRTHRKNNRIIILSAIAIALAILLILIFVFDQKSNQPNTSSSSSPSSASSTPASNSQNSSSSQTSSLQSSSSQNSSSQTASTSSNTSANKELDYLIVVNKTHKMPEVFNAKLITAYSPYKMEEKAAKALQEMFNAAKKDGIKLQLVSAWRSVEKQTQLYKDQVKRYTNQGYSQADAEIEAAKYVAIPGTSEHNTGLAADILSQDYYSKFDDFSPEFETTKEFKWMYENCAKFGFILRYPKDKQDITKITYEPWHYRYVGVEDAKKIMDQKVCLEEYTGKTK